MKKIGVLNAQLSGLIAKLGHKDKFMIGDAGMPIPDGVEIVDLALCCGIPRFEDVLVKVLEEVEVEKYFYATETEEISPAVFQMLDEKLPEREKESMCHDDLKAFSANCKFAIRTGETTPYCNVILQSGVTF